VEQKQDLLSDQQDTISLQIQNMPKPGEQSVGANQVKVEFGAHTHPGKIRENNEDHYIIAKFNRNITPILSNIPADEIPGPPEEATYGMVIADGMGGQVGGEIASRTAIQILMHLVLKAPKWAIKMNEQEAHELMERASRYFKKIDSALTQKSKNEPALAGMGTTLTAAYNTGREVFIVHVGDSRAYLFRRGELFQITRDQTVAQALADAGSIKREEVSSHPLRHMLTNAIGYRAGQIEADIQEVRLLDGDLLLLCTDGLTEMVNDAAITKVLTQTTSPSEACNNLVDLALENGGKDNVTVLIASYRIDS
jgi:protein phosphatase